MTSTNTAVTATRAKQNWLTWFDTRDSATMINKSNQEQLLKKFDSAKSESDVLEALLKHEETVYIHKVPIGERRIATFHHLVEVGGTIYTPTAKEYGMIQGLGDNQAQFSTPDIENLLKVESNNAVPVPTQAHVTGVKTVTEVDALTTSASVTYKPRNFVPVPPLVLKTVHETIATTNGDAKQVLVKCAQAIKTFDADHNEDDEYTDKAQSKCKPFLYWLYLTAQNSDAIKATATIGCSHQQVIKALKQREDSIVENAPPPTELSTIAAQVESSLKRPFEVLAATSSSTSEFMEKLAQIQSQNAEKNSKTFKKIPAKFQQMILVAASTSEVTEMDYNAEAVEFFKCSNTLHAQVMLNSMFEAENIDVSVSSALATMLLMGSFLWRHALAPSGLASSVLSSEGILRSDTLHEGMVLDYATKFEISSASLSKLTKTQVLFPTNVEELTHRIRGIHSLAVFFFRKHTFLSLGLKKVVNFCLDNRTLLRTRIYLDIEFIAKFLVAIDDRIYQWLKQCSTTTVVTETDLTLVDFSTMISDIQLNRFVYALPPSIAKLVPQEEEGRKTKPNGGKSHDRDKVSVVRNNEMDSNWKLRRQETWNNVFRNKTIEGPMLSMQCHPCLKYHVRGTCFEDCKNKSSHCVLKGDDRSKINTFIKSLRGE